MAKTVCQQKNLACDYEEVNANLKKELVNGKGVYKVRYRCKRRDCGDVFRRDETREIKKD